MDKTHYLHNPLPFLTYPYIHSSTHTYSHPFILTLTIRTYTHHTYLYSPYILKLTIHTYTHPYILKPTHTYIHQYILTLKHTYNTLSHITVTADGIFTKRSLLLRSNLLLVIKSFYKHGESEEDPSHDFALLWQGEARAKNYLWGLTTEREREREREREKIFLNILCKKSCDRWDWFDISHLTLFYVQATCN